MRLQFRQLAVAACSLLLLSTPSLALAKATSPGGLLYEKTRSWQVPYKPVDLVQSVDGKFVFILTENNQVLVYEPNGNLKGSIPVASGITAIDSDARGENILLLDSQKNTFTSISVDFVVDIDTSAAPFKGRPDAPVTIAVFSDFE